MGFPACDKTINELCYVNGINIILSDFGTVYHDKPIDIELPTFTPKPSTEHVLNKYGITEEEYKEIADRLTDIRTWGIG